MGQIIFDLNFEHITLYTCEITKIPTNHARFFFFHAWSLLLSSSLTLPLPNVSSLLSSPRWNNHMMKPAKLEPCSFLMLARWVRWRNWTSFPNPRSSASCLILEGFSSLRLLLSHLHTQISYKNWITKKNRGRGLEEE